MQHIMHYIVVNLQYIIQLQLQQEVAQQQYIEINGCLVQVQWQQQYLQQQLLEQVVIIASQVVLMAIVYTDLQQVQVLIQEHIMMLQH